MKKLFFHIAALYFSVLGLHAQERATLAPKDTTAYQVRKLKLDEVGFVSGYYHQDGNNSAVTGGIGTEKLTDFANTINLQFSNTNRQGKKNTLSFELGIDHYSSASSDKIDPNTISSASSADTRVYPSLHWNRSDEKTGNAYGFTGSSSVEFDYQSLGGAFNVTRVSKDKNRQFDMKLQAFLDTWKVILPVELRTATTGSGSKGDPRGDTHSPRNSFSASFSLSQVINERLQALITAEPGYQHGLLATKYQRDFFTDGSERAETLPDNRYKLPVSLRLNYFATDRLIFRTFYRYYTDDWGIRSHTAELEMPVKITPFFSLSPFYRYATQTGTRYFAAYGQHKAADQYFTSDYDLSDLNSTMVGAGIRLVPPHGVFGMQRFNTLELRYGHYTRSTGLASDILTLSIKVK